MWTPTTRPATRHTSRRPRPLRAVSQDAVGGMSAEALCSGRLWWRRCLPTRIRIPGGSPCSQHSRYRSRHLRWASLTSAPPDGKKFANPSPTDRHGGGDHSPRCLSRPPGGARKVAATAAGHLHGIRHAQHWRPAVRSCGEATYVGNPSVGGGGLIEERHRSPAASGRFRGEKAMESVRRSLSPCWGGSARGVCVHFFECAVLRLGEGLIKTGCRQPSTEKPLASPVGKWCPPRLHG